MALCPPIAPDRVVDGAAAHSVVAAAAVGADCRAHQGRIRLDAPVAPRKPVAAAASTYVGAHAGHAVSVPCLTIHAALDACCPAAVPLNGLSSATRASSTGSLPAEEGGAQLPKSHSSFALTRNALINSRDRVSVHLFPSSTSLSSMDSAMSGGSDTDAVMDELNKSVQQFVQTFERRIDGFQPRTPELQRAVLRTSRAHARPEDCAARVSDDRGGQHAMDKGRENDSQGLGSDGSMSQGNSERPHSANVSRSSSQSTSVHAPRPRYVRGPKPALHPPLFISQILRSGGGAGSRVSSASAASRCPAKGALNAAALSTFQRLYASAIRLAGTVIAPGRHAIYLNARPALSRPCPALPRPTPARPLRVFPLQHIWNDRGILTFETNNVGRECIRAGPLNQLIIHLTSPSETATDALAGRSIRP